MKKYCLSFLLSLFAVCPVFAGGGVNVSSLINDWGGGSLNTCGAHALVGTEACIGASQSKNCDAKGVYARNYTDEYGMQMMVARKLTKQGGYFCPTQLEGKNKNKGNAWTEAGDLSVGNNSLCVWLCKSGFTGSECELAESEVKSCDTKLLKRSDYSYLQRQTAGANIENNIAMFVFNKYAGCGVNKGQEHDMILAITKWTPSGHGAFVQQMVWRAERSGWKDMISWASIYPATNSQEILVCKNGYRPNPANTDCEEINSNLCRSQSLCNGWSGFDETIHTFYQLPENDTCYQFRCVEPGTAFPSKESRICEPCTSEDIRAGVSPADGTCVHCESGKIFDESAASSGYCAVATAYTKTDMQYGKDQTKNTVELDKQCWIIADPEDYEDCVRGRMTDSSGESRI